MELGTKFSCEYTGDAVLVVTKKYGENMFALNLEGTDRTIMASCAQLGKPRLCLVHVSGTELNRLEGKLHD